MELEIEGQLSKSREGVVVALRRAATGLERVDVVFTTPKVMIFTDMAWAAQNLRDGVVVHVFAQDENSLRSRYASAGY